MRRACLPLIFVAFLAMPATAGDDYYGSSLLAWVDAVAQALELRAAEAGARAVVLDVRGGRGVADAKAQRVFLPRLAERLRERGHLLPADCCLAARIDLSLDGASLWAVGMLEGGGLPGPSALAVSWPIDRELEAVLATAPSRAGQARWAMERLGTVPAGVLDAVLIDLDGDRADEIVLLSVDGVRALRWEAGESRPQERGGPWPLPQAGPWPRVVGGWIARSGPGRVRVATTAGHAADLDATSGAWRAATEGVPLRQPVDPGREPVLLAVLAGPGPVLGLPESPAPIPSHFRDLVRLPGTGGGWIWVQTDGTLAGVDGGGEPAVLPGDRAGDRIAVGDLDGDGAVDLVTTAAEGPTGPDRVTIHRIESGLDGQGVIFRSALDGSVAALAIGDLDFDGNADLLLVEEGAFDRAIVWRVERAR